MKKDVEDTFAWKPFAEIKGNLTDGEVRHP